MRSAPHSRFWATIYWITATVPSAIHDLVRPTAERMRQTRRYP